MCRPSHKVRFVNAAALFDGYDTAINIMRRIVQSMGAELTHLGRSRSVDEVVTTARCKKTLRASPSAATKAGMSNTSITWWTC